MIKMLPCIVSIAMIPASLLSSAFMSEEIIDDAKPYIFMSDFYEFSEHKNYLEEFQQILYSKPAHKTVKIPENLPHDGVQIIKQKNDLDNNDKKCTKRTRYQFEIYDREEILPPKNTNLEAVQKEDLISALSTQAPPDFQCPIKKSRSPVFDAFVLCILKEYGIKFIDKLNGKLLFSDAASYNLFMNCIDVTSKNINKNCAAEAKSRHVLISQYFDYLPSRTAMLMLKDELEVTISVVYGPKIYHKIEQIKAIGTEENPAKRHKKSKD